MKFFMPTYAVALTLAVTSAMFEQTAGAACDATTVCGSPSTCATPVTAGETTAAQVARPQTGWTACTGDAKAYLKSLTVIAGLAEGGVANTATDPTKIKVRVSKTTTPVASGDTPIDADASPACDNTYTNIGKRDATADVTATISCLAAPCKFTYKAVYECQPAACDPTTPCATTGACPAVSTTSTSGAATTSGSLTRPATTVLGACADKKFAYVKKLQIFPEGASAGSVTPSYPATKVDDIVVTAIKDGGSTGAVVASDAYPACATQWSNIGSDATADVKLTITCATTKTCNFKYKIDWGCQGDSFAATPTPTPSTGAAGTCTVAAWGTALVAAVAGANFAAPL